MTVGIFVVLFIVAVGVLLTFFGLGVLGGASPRIAPKLPPCSLELEYRRQAAEKAQRESLRLDSVTLVGDGTVDLTFVGASATAFYEAVKLYRGHKVRIILEPIE